MALGDKAHGGFEKGRMEKGSAPNAHTHSYHHQESIEINAPIWRVYEAWSHIERFSEFIPEIDLVECLGPCEYRWYAQGVSGEEVCWHVRVLEDMPNKRVSWEAEACDPQSYLRHAGAIELEAISPSHTRITFRLDHIAAEENPLKDWLDRVFHREPGFRLRQCLENFRDILEFETHTTRSHTTER